MRQAQHAAVAAAMLIGDGVAEFVVRKTEAARVKLMSVSDETIEKTTKIQAAARGHFARTLRRQILHRRAAQAQQRRFDAAFRIQLWARVCMAKSRVHFLRDKRRELQKRNNAAVWMQVRLIFHHLRA